MVKFQSALKSRSLSQMVAKKHLKGHLKRIRDREYSRLRAMVPSIAAKEKVSKVEVIEEAVKYIDELHRALLERLGGAKGKVDDFNKLSDENVRQMMRNVMSFTFNPSPQVIVMERQQRLPSYLTEKRRLKPTRFS
ncbi:hypothetical protein CHS0354_021292 [Potamilus streckersoni]|uniref:BHLH domain-containing protein n=1 Tax=Potamilus streckersoni TaxID=2493646 RepID=A0AAE0TKZ1_9BIVA|nr:hypothetical protein CHS0354_021292 [Potamilus streckersoni]